jgi:hypothetical protein
MNSRSAFPNRVAGELFSLKGQVGPDQVTASHTEIGRRQLRLKVLDGDDGMKPLILIEGNKADLLFLADLLIAQAVDSSDCGFQLTATAEWFFSPDTEAGVYIHTLPCAHTDAPG